MDLVWIVALAVAVALIAGIVLTVRPHGRRKSDELEGASWDERTRPTNDPFFKNRQYYSHH